MSALSPERLRQVYSALEQAGSIHGAANILGCDRSVVKRAIKNHPELGSCLPTAQPPTEEQVMVRKRIKPVGALASVSEGPLGVAKAVASLEEKFSLALKRAGVTSDEEIEKINALQSLGAVHFTSIRQFHSGSMLDMHLALKREYDAITRQLAEGDYEDPEFEKMLREDRGRIMQALIQIGDRLDKSLLTAALVEAKKAEGKTGKTAGRPGFTALVQKTEITAHGPLTVTESRHPQLA